VTPRPYAPTVFRVQRPHELEPTVADGVERRLVVPPERGSELALDHLRLDHGASLDLRDDVHDTLVFAYEEERGRGGTRAGGRSTLFFPAAEPGGDLIAGDTGMTCVRTTIGADTDLHAPLGAVEQVVGVDRVEPGKATGARSFQLLHGPHNGSTRATLFVGYIPSGRAPWHYHLYDEIVWILDGEGRLHLGDDVEELAPGCAFRLRPREVHVVENTSPDRELAVLGVFTPAGSPSAAYLTADIAETYAFSG